MKALSIKPGWSNKEKWADGTDIDDYSIVDWIKTGMGESIGINKDATMEVRKILYNKYYIAKQQYFRINNNNCYQFIMEQSVE